MMNDEDDMLLMMRTTTMKAMTAAMMTVVTSRQLNGRSLASPSIKYNISYNVYEKYNDYDIDSGDDDDDDTCIKAPTSMGGLMQAQV